MSRVGQNHILYIYTVYIRYFWQGDHQIYVELARTIYIRCISGFFGTEITKYTVIHGANIWFWPTLNIRSYWVHTYGFGQPYIYWVHVYGTYWVHTYGHIGYIHTVLANPTNELMRRGGCPATSEIRRRRQDCKSRKFICWPGC